MMKKLWTETLDLVRQGGVQTVTLKHVDASGGLIETTTNIANLSDDSVEHGITLEGGTIVYPNPTTAVLNPFKANPVISFNCDINRRPVTPAPPVTEIPSSHLEPTLATTIDSSAPMMKTIKKRTPPQPKEVGPDGQRGTSCHQCKNARSLDQLAHCSNLFNKRTSSEMRHCRKKFCLGCLSKSGIPYQQGTTTWICPSCRGICRCAACSRKRRKSSTDRAPPPESLMPSHRILTTFEPDAMNGMIMCHGAVSGTMPAEEVLSIGKIQHQGNLRPAAILDVDLQSQDVDSR
jgi:hypothetical protein